MDSNTFALGLLALITIGLGVVISQVFATIRARDRAKSSGVDLDTLNDHSEELRQLDERVTELARELEDGLRRLEV